MSNNRILVMETRDMTSSLYYCPDEMEYMCIDQFGEKYMWQRDQVREYILEETPGPDIVKAYLHLFEMWATQRPKTIQNN